LEKVACGAFSEHQLRFPGAKGATFAACAAPRQAVSAQPAHRKKSPAVLFRNISFVSGRERRDFCGLRHLRSVKFRFTSKNSAVMFCRAEIFLQG